MTASDWIAMVGLCLALFGTQWALLRANIMSEVDMKIAREIDKIKDDRIRQLSERLEDERNKNEYLKEKIKDMK